MASMKTPPSLPIELWVKILQENQPNPIELCNYSQIRKGKNEKSLDSKGWLDDAFFDSFRKAATHNSLMKRYSPALPEGTNLLGAFVHRLENTSSDIRQAIVSLCLGRLAFRDASPELRNNKEIVMTALKLDKFGDVLKYASPELRNNKEVVMAAVQIYRGAFQYASPELQDDKEVRMAAGRNRCI